VEEKRFIDEAIRKGIITSAEVQGCLKARQSMAEAGIPTRIWEILIFKGLATREQVRNVMKGLGAPGQ
jgi:hypothetical protein